MEKIIDMLNGLLTIAISSGMLSIKQGFFVVFAVGAIGISIWKIRNIISFFNDVRNSKINEYRRFLSDYNISRKDKDCINNEIIRIVRYRVSGISDIPRQKIVWSLLFENKEKISLSFFKKFRTHLEIKNNVLIFKKGKSFWIENAIYGFYSIQFLILSILSVAFSIYSGAKTPMLGHVSLHLGAVIMFVFFIAFANLITRPRECQLLSEMLTSHYSVDNNGCNHAD